MRGQNRTVEQRIAALAKSAHGVVTRSGLIAAGVTSKQVERRLASGALIRVHSGVYRVGHCARSVEASYLAAVLACGAGALLGGRASGWLWSLLTGAPPAPEVWAPTERTVTGVRTRRARGIGGWERATCRGVPALTVAHTLVDLAAVLSLDGLARACHEAGVRYRTTPRQVAAVLAACSPRAPGAANLRRVLEGDVRVSLSELEARFLAVLRAVGLPLPDQTNRLVGARRVDCRWRRPALTVELDSYRYHASRHAWEQDRRREREAYARGDQFRRYTWGDVFEDPSLMLAELGVLLLAEPFLD